MKYDLFNIIPTKELFTLMINKTNELLELNKNDNEELYEIKKEELQLIQRILVERRAEFPPGPAI